MNQAKKKFDFAPFHHEIENVKKRMQWLDEATR